MAGRDRQLAAGYLSAGCQYRTRRAGGTHRSRPGRAASTPANVATWVPYRDSHVLFEPATSAFDNATKRVVMEAIHRLAGPIQPLYNAEILPPLRGVTVKMPSVILRCAVRVGRYLRDGLVQWNH